MKDVPDHIARELDSLTADGIAWRIEEKKERNLIYVVGEYAGFYARKGKDQRHTVTENTAAQIRRVALKHRPPSITKSVKKEEPMTQSPEFAALNSRLGRIEHLLEHVLKAFDTVPDDQKVIRHLLDQVSTGVDLLLENAPKPPVPSLPKGWLKTAIREIMGDGEKRHIFEVWKSLKVKYPELSEASVAASITTLCDDGELKRERQGIYYAEKEAEAA